MATWAIILSGYLFLQGVGALCPDAFERHGESCYKVVGMKVTWIDAKRYCNLLGGDLAAIETEAEEKQIEGMLKRLHGSTNPELYWLDGSDFASEGIWKWMGENGQSRIITYSNWLPGQPDDSSNNEHCMIMVYTAGLEWNDVPCTVDNNFICETSIHWDSEGQVIG